MCMSVLPSPSDSTTGGVSNETLWPSLLEKAVSFIFILYVLFLTLRKVYEVNGRIRFPWIVSDPNSFDSKTHSMPQLCFIGIQVLIYSAYIGTPLLFLYR